MDWNGMKWCVLALLIFITTDFLSFIIEKCYFLV
jgi:hypothetical protein